MSLRARQLMSNSSIFSVPLVTSDDEETFDLPDDYIEICPLGKGGYGSVMYIRRSILIDN